MGLDFDVVITNCCLFMKKNRLDWKFSRLDFGLAANFKLGINVSVKGVVFVPPYTVSFDVFNLEKSVTVLFAQQSANPFPKSPSIKCMCTLFPCYLQCVLYERAS